MQGDDHGKERLTEQNATLEEKAEENEVMQEEDDKKMNVEKESEKPEDTMEKQDDGDMWSSRPDRTAIGRKMKVLHLLEFKHTRRLQRESKDKSGEAIRKRDGRAL